MKYLENIAEAGEHQGGGGAEDQALITHEKKPNYDKRSVLKGNDEYKKIA